MRAEMLDPGKGIMGREAGKTGMPSLVRNKAGSIQESSNASLLGVDCPKGLVMGLY